MLVIANVEPQWIPFPKGTTENSGFVFNSRLLSLFVVLTWTVVVVVVTVSFLNLRGIIVVICVRISSPPAHLPESTTRNVSQKLYICGQNACSGRRD